MTLEEIEAIYAQPSVCGEDYVSDDGSLRQALAIALAVLDGETVSFALRAQAQRGVKLLLAQKGCSYLRGQDGLVETCEIMVFS